MQGNCQKPDIEAYGPPARPGFEMNIILIVRTMMMLIAKTKSMVMAMVMVILRVVTMVLAMAISFKN